jgi:hypothetical protein
MDTPSNVTDNLDQADEDILTYTASDDALEAAAGTGGVTDITTSWALVCHDTGGCCL